MKRFIIFFMGMVLSAYTCAQSYRLSGKVIQANQQALQSLVVGLSDTNYRSLTDSAGRFSFTNLPAGSYNVGISALGYQEYSRPLTIKNKDVFITIVLHEQSHHLREVVITDNHVQTRKESESMNVEVINQNFIQRNLGGSLMATLSRLPGIKTIGIGSGQSKPLIRGMGFNRVVVVDKGIKHEGQQWGADHGLEIDQFAAGEVELIKGAASFVYGSDAIAGVVDVKPAPFPAVHSTGGSADLIGKSNNNLYGTSINLYSRSQKWFFDSRVTYQNYGDYRVPTDTVFVYSYAVGLHNNHLRNTAGRETGFHLNTGYVGEKFRTLFYISNISSRSGFFANAHGLEPRQVNTALHDSSSRDLLLPRQEVNHFKVINQSRLETGVHLLETEIGYQHNFRQEFSHYVNHGYMPPIYPETLPIPSDLEREFDKRVYSLNFRDRLAIDRHELTFGLNGEYQDNNISGWGFLVPGFRQSLAGLFVYDKYLLSKRVLLHGALRYDYGRSQMFRYTDWFETRGEKLVRADNLTRNFNSLIWSAGINYTPESAFSMKANIGKSFRMPITKELGANGVNYHYFSYEIGTPTLDPEQSYQADLSLAWKTGKCSMLVSPFYNYFTNYIYLNPTARHSDVEGAGNQVFVYSQSRVMRYGGELQLKYQLLKSLSTELLAEYLYNRQLSGDKKGYTLPFSPPPSVLLNLTWSPTVSCKLQNSYISVDYLMAAAQNKIVPPERKTPAYGLVNLQVGTRLRLNNEWMTLSLQAQNLFNTRYLNHTSFYRLIELPEAGRNIVLSLKVPFTIRSANNEPAQ